jgi:hypothetical protein
LPFNLPVSMLFVTIVTTPFACGSQAARGEKTVRVFRGGVTSMTLVGGERLQKKRKFVRISGWVGEVPTHRMGMVYRAQGG